VLIATGNNRIRVIAASTGTFYGIAMTANDIYTMAGNGTSGFSGDGGSATSAQLGFPLEVAADSHGNTFIADFNSFRVRVVAGSTTTFYGVAMTAGHIYTIAGNGSSTFSGDGGPAVSAGMNLKGITVDGDGNLLTTDVNSSDNSGHLRVVAASTGTFYNVAMTVGDIYTVDLGSPSAAAVAVDPAENVFLGDTTTNKVYESKFTP
jgi:hypothetical protein